MDKCLLTDEEVAEGPEKWKEFGDGSLWDLDDVDSDADTDEEHGSESN